jgi:hypothetical protein
MTREAITRLLVAIGLASLLLIGVALPLRAASSTQPVGHQRAKNPVQTAITETTPITPGLVVTPTSLVTPSTASLTLLPVETSTLAPAPTQKPTLVPTPIAIPTPIRSPINQAIVFLSTNRVLAGAICLIPLFILALLLVILALRKGKTAPTPSLLSTPAAPPTIPAGPYLESIHTAGGPRRFGLGPEGITVGRDRENDLVITQDFSRWETVSNYHARIYQLAGHWIVEDIDSMNGVYVNGKRTGRNLLQNGWQLDIGGVGFVFRARTEETGQ